jgi:hypothetical protein
VALDVGKQNSNNKKKEREIEAWIKVNTCMVY